MERLNYQDLQTLLSALSDLHADFDARTLPQRTIAAVDKIIPGEVIFLMDSEMTDATPLPLGIIGRIYIRRKGRKFSFNFKINIL